MTPITRTFVVLIALIVLLASACGGKRTRIQTPTSTTTATATTVPATAYDQSPVFRPEDVPASETTVATGLVTEQLPDSKPASPSATVANSLITSIARVEVVNTATKTMQRRTNEVFLGEYDLVLPQAGEVESLDTFQFKAAITGIISPKQGESAEVYRSRVNNFRTGYLSVPKRYTDQVAYVSKAYQEVTGLNAQDLPKDGPMQPAEVRLIQEKSEVAFPGNWQTFSRFRVDPLGAEINPNATEGEVISEIGKSMDKIIPQVVRTTYDPSMKTEWIETLQRIAAGERGPAVGDPKIVRILDWSHLWEYTSGEKSSAVKVEFIPTPQFVNARALVFFLPRSGKFVGHALPCGFNPIVFFTETIFRGTAEAPKPPEKCDCEITSISGRREGDLTVIEPGQPLEFTLKVTGDLSRIKIIREEVLVDGVSQEIPNQGKLSQTVTLNSGVFQHGVYNHTYSVQYRLTYESAGQTFTVVCPLALKVRVNNPEPRRLDPKCLVLETSRQRLGPKDMAVITAKLQDVPEGSVVEWRVNGVRLSGETGLQLKLRGDRYEDLRSTSDREMSIQFRTTTPDGKVVECETALTLPALPAQKISKEKDGPGFCGPKGWKCWLPAVIAGGVAAALLAGGDHEPTPGLVKYPGSPGGWSPSSVSGSTLGVGVKLR